MSKCIQCRRTTKIGNCLTCVICQQSIHNRCSALNHDERAYVNNHWFCTNCIGSNLPFNHIIDDDEFVHEINQFYQSERISFAQLQSLKINPFFLDDAVDKDNDQNKLYDIPKTNDKCNYHCSDSFNDLIKNKQSDLSIIHFNSRSLTKNMDQITDYLKTLNNTFDILAFSETWLNKNKVSSSLINIEGYHFVHDDRSHKRGGGVGLFISDKLNFTVRNDIKLPNSTEYDSLFVEINSTPKNLIIGIAYRPPDSPFHPFTDHLSTTIDKINNEHKPAFICGDFNIDLLKVQSHNSTNDFINTLYTGSFYPLINKPTRVTTKSSTLIDNIFTNILDLKITPGILYNDITDHFPIFQILNTNNNNKNKNKINNNNYITKRKININNISSLGTELSQTDWNNVLQSDSANESYNNFISKFTDLYNKHLPKVKTKINKRKDAKPWITSGIIKSIKTRNKLYKTFIKHPNETNKSKYVAYRNKLTHIIRISCKNHYHNKFNSYKNDIKNTWKTINEILGKNKKEHLPTYFNDNNTKINDPQVIASKFNTFFADIGPSLANKIHTTANFSDFLSSQFPKSIFFNPTSRKEILDIIATFKSGKSSGYDDISPTVIKQIAPFITEPLTHVFNLSLSTGVFPSALKIAKVIPIFKKDDPHSFSNYRPISLLPCFSKILERLIYNRLDNFLSLHNILHPNQYGFRKHHSTDLALLDIYDKISSALSNHLHTIGIFLDLSKAFDTIDHSILLTKLHHYGIRGTPLALLSDYLHNRQQFTCFDSHSSGLLPVSCGVPQGSILGPLLFLLYVNDIPNASRSLSFVLFADDTNIFLSHPNLQTLEHTFNTEIQKVTTWFKANKLSLNVNKTNFIHFKTNKKSSTSKINLVIDNTVIKPVDNTKFLGVIIDCKLNWNDHITKITNQVARSIGIIKKLRFTLPAHILFSMYNTLALPYLSYCNISWANTSQTTDINHCPWTQTNTSKINSLFKLQKKALRLCTNSEYSSHTKHIFHTLNTLNIYDLNKLQTGLFMYRFENNTLPISFQDFFMKNNATHNYNTRSASQLKLIRPNLNINKYSIKYSGSKLWNSLDSELKNSKTINSFKSNYKKTLISKYNN